MSTRWVLPLALLCQLLFLGLVLMNDGMANTLFFGLFWLATIASLLILISKRSWDESSWVAFGAFSASLVTGVLLSTHVLIDPVGVSVSVMGLLFVAAVITSFPSAKPRRRVRPRRAPKMPDTLIYSIPGSEKYHRKGCRMLTDRDDLEGFMSEQEAKKAGKSKCKLCF